MRILTDETGREYGSLTVIGPHFRVGRWYAGKYRNVVMCVCECKCGSIVAHYREWLNDHSVCKPGCRFSRFRRGRKTGGPLYNCWNSMKYRCYNPKCQNYRYYGGRGITCCQAWIESFDTFVAWAKSSGWEPGLQIDRIDNDGNYEPENCRWVTVSQNRRNRSDNRLLSYLGEEKTMVEWSEDARCAVKPERFVGRITNGWEVHRAFTQPKRAW